MKNPFVVILCLGSMAACLSVHGQDSASAYFQKAKSLQQERRWKDAENYYQKSLDLKPDNYEVLANLAGYYSELYMYKEEKETLTKMYALRQDDVNVLSKLAKLTFNLHKYEEAIVYYSALNKLSPSEDTDIKLGKAYDETEDYGKSIEAFERALQKNPKNPESLYNLGYKYEQLGNYRKALPFYLDAFNLQPTENNMMRAIIIYNTLGDYNNAVALMERASAAGVQRNRIFLENLGNFQLQTKDYEKGIETLQEVLIKKPNSLDILKSIAKAYSNNFKYQKSIEYLEKVLAIDDKDYRSLFSMGVAYQKMGKVEKGKAICEDAIRMDPSLQKYRTEKFSF